MTIPDQGFLESLCKTPLTNGMFCYNCRITTFRWFESKRAPRKAFTCICLALVALATIHACPRLKGGNRRFPIPQPWLRMWAPLGARGTFRFRPEVNGVYRSRKRSFRSPSETRWQAQEPLGSVRTTTTNFVGHPVGVISDRMQIRPANSGWCVNPQNQQPRPPDGLHIDLHAIRHLAGMHMRFSRASELHVCGWIECILSAP